MRTYSKRTNYKFIIILSFLTGITITSCKKFIEVPAPITSINRDNVYSNDNYATSVLTGLYAAMSGSTLSLNLSVYPELSADNLTLFDKNNIPELLLYTNTLNAGPMNASFPVWNNIYSYIYITNAAIEGLSNSNSLSSKVKQRLLGEAYFLRGFYYFYLTNLFGEVPLALTTDYQTNSVLPKSNTELIYDQIINDLKNAQASLDDNYVDGTAIKITVDRVRPNRMAANALLSRVYLYVKKYREAEMECNKVIQANNVFDTTDLNSVFLKNSKETIWALQPVATGINTMEGNFYIYSDEGPSYLNYTNISPSLLNTFEEGDLRKKYWISKISANGEDYYYPFKYKVKTGDPYSPTEYTIVLRLAEQYLIRAEARIQQGNVVNGIKDLNALRKRSRDVPTADTPFPLPEISEDLSKDNALKAVAHERRTELFTEWGNRWFDLKRSGNIDQVMAIETPKKGGVWNKYQSFYPIPNPEILRNPNLVQNPGYTN